MPLIHCDLTQTSRPTHFAVCVCECRCENMLSHHVFFVLLLCLSCATSATAFLKNKPDYLDTCIIKNPEFVKCSTASIQKLFKNIKNGIPDISLPPIDPLKIDSINIVQGGEGPVSVNAKITNVTIYGFGDMIVKESQVDPRTYEFRTKLYLDRIRIEGTYHMLGRILVLPLRGHGKCWFEVRKVPIYLISDVNLIEKGGFHFYNLTGVHIQFSLGDLKMHMGNLFDGLKTLEDSTNRYLNENWKPVEESLHPILAKTFEDIMLVILRQIFNEIPADFFVEDIANPL